MLGILRLTFLASDASTVSKEEHTMRYATRFMLIVVLLLGWALPAQAQSASGFEHTSFNVSFDLSSVDQIGDDSPDLRFRDVTFGAELPMTERIGVWVTVSKSADFTFDAAEGERNLTGSFGGGLSYLVADMGNATFDIQGGIISRFERVGDGDLNPSAARISGKVGYRLLGEPDDSRWFGLFLQGGSDIALRDIMSVDDGDIVRGDTTYHTRMGLEFSF